MKKILCILLFFPVCLHAQTINITTPTDTICSGSFVHFKATYTGVITPHFKWQINSTNTGTDSAGYTTHTLSNNDTVSCLLTNSLGDTIFAVSNNLIFTVQHMPVVSPIIGKDSIVCVGATITLSDSTAGGVWWDSSGYATVSEGVVTAIFATNYFHPDTIFYIKTNTCGADTSKKTIVVESMPYAYGFYISNGSICIGETKTVTDDFYVALYSTFGYVSRWNCPLTVYDNTCIIGMKAGRDYVYSTATNACGTSTSGQWVIVTDKPAITFICPPEICLGDTVKIIDSSDGSPPAWHVDNYGATIYNNKVITGISPGLATITLSASNQCGTAFKTTSINILPPGQIKVNDSICIGKSIALTDTTKGGTWKSNNHNVAVIDQSGIVTGISQGYTFITYTLPSGCLDTGIINVADCIYKTAVFPNPSKYEVTLQVDTSFFYAYSVMNSIGQVMLKKNVDGPITKINTQLFPPGVYMINFYGYYDVHSEKFLKE